LIQGFEYFTQLANINDISLIIWSITVVSLDALVYKNLLYEDSLVDLIGDSTEDIVDEGDTDATDIIAGSLRRMLKPSPKGGAGGGGDSCG